ELAYGANARPGIPPNSVLIFEVELLDITPGLKPWVPAKKHDTITTPSGLKYIIFAQNKDSVMPVKGDDIKMHYSGFFLNGKMFDSSVERAQPLPFVLGLKMVIPGWEEMVALMHKGDRIKVIVPPALAYGEKGFQKLIPPNATLMFDMELVEVGKVKYDITGAEKHTSVGGTEACIVKQGAGASCGNGKKICVHYSGYLENGDIFDSSRRGNKPYCFTLGTGSVIPGWDEGLLFAKQGDKLRLVIPYQQAYGENGRPPIIPPKATLIFDIEVMSVQ
ncbi:MAG: FKBP-type peptidylprolyl isomerase, partial [Bacteroidetes bacterium]